jgi:hypothetical protein
MSIDENGRQLTRPPGFFAPFLLFKTLPWAGGWLQRMTTCIFYLNREPISWVATQPVCLCKWFSYVCCSLNPFVYKFRSRNSSVCIANGYVLEVRGSIPGSARLFSPQSPDSGAHPPYPMGTGGGVLSPVVKRQEREPDHSPLSSAEVKNGGATLPLPHTSSWNNV